MCAGCVLHAYRVGTYPHVWCDMYVVCEVYVHVMCGVLCMWHEGMYGGGVCVIFGACVKYMYVCAMPGI